jgi:hypothetical protein
MHIEKDGQRIMTLGEWKQHAPPKGGDRQWKAGRSAYELASAWCGKGAPAMPRALKDMLDSRLETSRMAVDGVFPECQIPFDSRAGEPRNADLAFVGRRGEAKVAVTIEAKADEPYGATIAKTACDAFERRIVNPRSQGVERIVDLITSLLPPWEKGCPHVEGLYYQLLTATAGSIAYARIHGAAIAVMIIHEFRTEKTDDALHGRNEEAYSAFLHRIRGSAPSQDELGSLLGPFLVPGTPLFDSPPALYIGKIVTDLRGKRAPE